MADNLDTGTIRQWRSIVTLIVFVITNLLVLFPVHMPIWVPRNVYNTIDKLFATLRISRNREQEVEHDIFVKLHFPWNFVTAPLIAVLFLLAISAIGRLEVHDGIVGANNISPIDILTFFLTLAYIAISLDSSGIIRYLAFKVVKNADKMGHRLYFYLYMFFFGLGTLIGNDPIILTGTAFLAYMTRASSNIKDPRAWIYAQFCIANISSASLVSSNPTNLVIAGAFSIRFITYTANMILPVFSTAMVLFPFLLYFKFNDIKLIPLAITMHELSADITERSPMNPNIPGVRQIIEEQERLHVDDFAGRQLSLEEIMNPFLDRGSAAFGTVLMLTTLITLLVLNAASQGTGEHPVFWVTLPAAFVMFCWDLISGWLNRKTTRKIAADSREAIAAATIERERRQAHTNLANETTLNSLSKRSSNSAVIYDLDMMQSPVTYIHDIEMTSATTGRVFIPSGIKLVPNTTLSDPSLPMQHNTPDGVNSKESGSTLVVPDDIAAPDRPTLISVGSEFYHRSQETFPTVMAVISHLPFALIAFALPMFILVQGLVKTGWITVFAYGWDHWVTKTGTIGAVGGMAFLSVVLCNFAGTNIGTSILLARMVQAWQLIHVDNGIPISNRTFWATVYSMAIGVNFGAFSTSFSASLAGLLWRDILRRKYIHVRSLDFARENIPIIAVSMAVGCVVLVGEVYIVRDDSPI